MLCGTYEVFAVQGGNAAIIKRQVQQQFQRNATETDPTKVICYPLCGGRHSGSGLFDFLSLLAAMQIAEQKDAAVRGLSNYMFMEAQRMAKVCLLRQLAYWLC